MNETEQTYHVPVFLQESICGLNLQDGGIYVDVTFGGGGHSREILRRMGKESRLFSFDQDEDAERNIVDDSRFTFVRSNFRYLRNFLRYYGVEEVDGILADLGVSSHHFDDSERGFSFRFDGKLDMRMNRRAGMTAADVVNTYDEERLADVFYPYGELKNSRKLANVLVKARARKPFDTIGDFLEVVKPLYGRERKKRIGESVSGAAHRSERRNAGAERNAVCGYRGVEARRETGGYHLSFAGRPHGKEPDENRKYRRKGRSGFLWKRKNTVPPDKQ